jgi:hypothetical protein
MRRALILSLLLAACSQDPLLYIPEAERRAAAVAAAGPAGPVSVEDMLARARTNESGTAAPARLLVRFEGTAVQPDAAQRESLRTFAMTAQEARQKLMVASRPGQFEDPGAPVLGQRRAVAVARVLSTGTIDVGMRFDPALPPGVVVVTRAVAP